MNDPREAMKKKMEQARHADDVGRQVQDETAQPRQQSSKVLSRKMTLVRFSLDPADVRLIDQLALKSGLARSAWIRRAVLETIERERRG